MKAAIEWLKRHLSGIYSRGGSDRVPGVGEGDWGRQPSGHATRWWSEALDPSPVGLRPSGPATETLKA